MEGQGIERARLEVIIYHALWQLRDLGPDDEPAYFRLTRLDLHDRLAQDGSKVDAPRARHLRVVGP